MKCRFLLTVGVILWSTWSGFAIEKTTVNLDNLVKTFEQNPANPQTTMQLLKELSKQGKSGQDILNRYFKTQRLQLDDRTGLCERHQCTSAQICF